MNGQLYQECFCGIEPVCSVCEKCERHCSCPSMQEAEEIRQVRMKSMHHNDILVALKDRVVSVREQKYNSVIKDYETVTLHYRLVLQRNINWNWLLRAHEDTDQKSLTAVQIENPAVQFDTYLISHANDFAYHFGLIDENHQISERRGSILSDIDFYRPQAVHINQNPVLGFCS